MPESSTSNPLRAAPFYLIPGINPDDPISAQMEQIDQLNTLLLQDIDHNFARFHQIVTSRLLPEIKRFALASEPTREAAKFWRSFFEAAAAVKVPVPGEFSSTEYEEDSRRSGIRGDGYDGDETFRPVERELDDEDDAHRGHRDEDDEDAEDPDMSINSEDRSFLYGNPVSSTPLAKKGQAKQPSHGGRNNTGSKDTGTHRMGGLGPDMSDISWQASSVDSPFEQLDKKLKENLHFQDDIADHHQDTPSLPSGYNYADYDEEPSVLISRSDQIKHQSNSKTGLAADESVLDAMNPAPPTPRVPTFKKPERPWSGVVDLRSTPLNAKMKARFDQTFGDDDDRVMPDMSPPVTMNFGLPTGGLTKTPAKEAAQLVIDDLMREMSGQAESPGLPTPPQFAKYTMEYGQEASPSRFRDHGDDLADLTLRREDASFAGQARDGSYDQGIDEDDELAVLRDDPSTVGMHPHAIPEDSFEDESKTAPSARSTLQALRESSNAMDYSMSSEAGSVFGGPKSRRGEGFALMRQDEMETYHGGRLEDAGMSPRLSPSYGLARSMGKKR